MSKQSTNGTKKKETDAKKTTKATTTKSTNAKKTKKDKKDKKPLTKKQKKSLAIVACLSCLGLYVGKGISDGDIPNPITKMQYHIEVFQENQEKKAAQKAWENEKVDDGTGNMKARYGITRLMYAKNSGDALENLIASRKMNPDAVGWINIPETDINGAIMQGMDNDYYLRRDENGDYDIYGCYFLDYECSIGTADDFAQNTVIYGHSDPTDNPNGKRFAQLYRFLEDDFAERVKDFSLTTINGTFKFEIFAAFYTDTDFIYNAVNISPEHKLTITNKAVTSSIRDYGIVPGINDKILTLSTCTVLYGTDNHRFVVMGRLVE